MDDKIRKIQEVVAEEYNITLKDLKSRDKNITAALPRQIAIYLIKTILNAPNYKISSAFEGRDDITIMYSYNRIKFKIKNDICFANSINKLINKIKEIFKEFKMKCKFCGSENTKETTVTYVGDLKGINRHALAECKDCLRVFGYVSKTEIPKIISSKYTIPKE